jgi:hypothetical protein
MHWKSGSISLLSCGLLAFFAFASGASGANLEEAYGADSEITLSEKAGSRTLTVRIATSNSRTTMSSDRSGDERVVEVNETDCSELWDDLLALPIDELESATPQRAYPDSSEFTLTLRVGSSSHSLTVYDVDSLEDERYRDAIRAILALERKHVTASTEG